MKKRYLEPEVEVLKFGAEDIITASGDDDYDEGEFGDWE